MKWPNILDFAIVLKMIWKRADKLDGYATPYFKMWTMILSLKYGWWNEYVNVDCHDESDKKC